MLVRIILLAYAFNFLGTFENANAQAPTISSFSPAVGPVGTLVTIIGTNLGSPTNFSIGGADAIVISNSGTTLVAMVMPGAITGLVSVTTVGGTIVSGSNFIVIPTPFPTTQEGDKLVATESEEYGKSVSISADGNTAIVGASLDNAGQGTVLVYTRSGSIWTQQGPKLVGTENIGEALQGYSVSLSADGNTAIIGGLEDNAQQGAAWVFFRSGGIWTQQGSKLVGSGSSVGSLFGASVSLSADGNTAIVGGPWDNLNQGAAWVFTRNGNIWTQQGNKLLGTGNIGPALQGTSVSISANGNTAMVGGSGDNSGQGAVWVFTRNGNIWTQQGEKLFGIGNIGAARQGGSISLSADGNTAMVGGSVDNASQGAVWVFTRNGNIWTQQGEKLVGTGNIGAAQQGRSISLSADGSTAIVGGREDDLGNGATWVFTRIGGIWSQQCGKLVGTGNIGNAQQGGSVSLSADGFSAIVGGIGNNNDIDGAAWVFISNTKHYFRSKISGNWNDPKTWESSPVDDFSCGVVSPAIFSPDINAKGINIRQGHIVSLTENVSVRKIYVNPAGSLSIIGCTLTQLEN